ncbi:hypothetical protein PV328_008047 [Microctonus aethiopoides]|uniref:Uncharacterized protein n=1 Tax=Microctonus aethiopoides TaxID=144406 RepID=A0AA39C9Z1_9HYME|nr:hypothetical protein PV328_008047 [Microctonus aethiopoides]
MSAAAAAAIIATFKELFRAYWTKQKLSPTLLQSRDYTVQVKNIFGMWDPASMVIKKTINSPRGRRATSNFGIAAGCRLGPVVAGGKCTPIAEYCRISDWTQLKR